MGYEDIMVGGKPLNQWEAEYSEGMETPELQDEDMIKMGIVRPEERAENPNQFYNTLDQLGVEHPEEGKEYQKLTVGETFKDIGKTVGAEALRFFAPKAGSKAADILHYSEDDLYKHESQTRIGEASKYLYRYTAGTLSFLAGGEAVGGVAIGLGAINRSEKLFKFGVGLQKVLGTAPLLKNGANAGKLKRVGTWIANKAIEGSVAGALADYNLYSKEEGHMADVFGVTDNPLISYLQTNENDTENQARLKNVVEGFLMGCPIGLGIGGLGAARNYFKSLKKVATAETKEGTTEAIKEFSLAQDQMNRTLETGELIQTVKDMRTHVSANGGDVEQLIMDNLPESQWDAAKKMNGVFDSGEDIFQHSDGTWDIRVNSWEDAHKVSKDEYKKQLTALDNLNGEERFGDTAIAQSDDAIRSTWTNRGWIGENESLINQTAKGNKGNTTLANKITKNYKDKWQIDNNIKVEFVDGLTINGQAVEGNTRKAKNTGKIAKNQQNAIDKKALQVQKLQDKVTMLEGGNEPVSDALDLAKEELRIAENELNELQKTAKKQNLKPDITIQIDVNAKNPYATLRAELEHARDFANGTVPNQKQQHFSRYEGLNEGEAAVDYTYKKSQSRAKAVQAQEDINNIINNAKTTVENGYSFKESPVDTFGGEGTRLEIISPDGNNQLGYLDYRIEGDTVHIEQVMNSSHGTSYYERGVADKLVDSILAQHPEKKIQWDATTKQGMNLKRDYLNSHPSLKDKTTGISTQEELESSIEKDYNARGEILNEQTNNRVSEIEGNRGEISGDSSSDDIRPDGEKIHSTDGQTSKNNMEDAVVGSNTRTNVSGKNTTNSGEPQQLTLDFSSSEDALNKLTSGEVGNSSLESIDIAISKAADKEIPVTGNTWKDLFTDVDNIPVEVKELLNMDIDELKQLFNEDRTTLSKIERKQLFSLKVASGIKEKLDALGKNAPIESKRKLIDALEFIKQYKKALGSGFGEGLNAQKPINQVLENFGNKRFSKLNREGVVNFMKLLEDITDELNFTRGDLVNNKKALLNRLAEENPALLSIIQEAGKPYQKTLDDILTDVAKNGKDADMKLLTQKLQDTFTNTEYEALYDALSLAKDKKSWWKTFRNWTNQYGGIESYYVHNLLSSPASIERNIFSGIVNTFYFPALKMVGGALTKDPALRKKMINEGLRTYSNLIVSMKEAWDLGCQAWLKGEGKLSSFTMDTMNESADGAFRGFHDMSESNNFFEWVQNIHSINTRLMGASDEFMKQLNYRALARTKAMEQIDEMAEQLGKVGDKDWYNERFQQVFDSYFEQGTGKATDPELFSEAAEILYQNPLSGKYQLEDGRAYDIRTGNQLEAGQKATQTSVMRLGENIQNMANHNLMAKIFFPFVKTGTNILQENLDHNIFYAIASDAQRSLLKSNTPQGAMARGKVAFGMFSFTMASMMAIGGLVTGSAPVDAKERKALYATGWRPYSLKIGDQYISYQGYEPLHTILGFAADSMNLMTAIATKEDEEKFGKYFLQGASVLFNNFLDKAAFRQGIQSMSGLLELSEDNLPTLEKAIASPIGGMLPDSAGVKYASTLGSRSATSPEGITQRIFNQYFNRGLGEYRRNAFGEKQTITNAVLFTSSTQPDSTPEDIELNRLAEMGYKPSEISEVKGGYNINFRDFTDENGRNAYDYMMEDLSESGLREAVRELVTSDYYNSLSADGINGVKEKLLGVKYTSTDETKVNALNDVFIEYNDEVKNNLTTKHPNLVNSKGETLEEAMDRADKAKESSLLGEQFEELY